MMKKIALTLLILVSVLSCSDNVEFNSPAIQGNKDGNLWRANVFKADIDYGGFLVEGKINSQKVQLITTADSPGIYDLGEDNTSEAIYVNEQGVVYSTSNAPDPSLSLYPAVGQIIVEDVENTNPKTVSGTFWFYAFSTDGLQTVNFNEGVFYKVPLLGGLVSSGNGCIQASEAAVIATQNFAATDTTMPNYTDVCIAYKAALLAQISSCGDESGVIQAIADSLGDCAP